MKGKTAGKIIALFAVAGMLAGCGGKTGTTPDDYATNDGYITTETAGNSTGGAQSDTTSGTAGISKENIKLSGLEDRKVRFIVDDVVKFVEREIRRGNKYDAIIMDPPSYGRGPKGEVWQIEEKLFDFVNLCMKVLSDKPLFFLINSYTTGFSPIVLENVLQTTIGKKVKGGKIYGGELGIPASRDGKILPCGIFGRWESK